MPHALAAELPASEAPTDSTVRVIVTGTSVDHARLAVEGSGGRDIAALDLIGGVSATVPLHAVTALRSAAGVRAVTTDGRLPLLDSRWGDDKTNQSRAASSDGSWKADKDLGSVWSAAKRIGAHRAYLLKDASGRHLSGRGIDVAVLDSGVVGVKGLHSTTRTVHGPDLSFESQVDSLRDKDTFGHGTHMAGIAVGADVKAPKDDPTPYTDPTNFTGIAPEARLVSLKLATSDGATDVSQVIAAIDWVVQNRTSNGLNIRVLNLSYGTDSLQPYELDPLSHAVEVAWRKGIVVVVSAGNDGLQTPRLTMPAANPFVIAVGASDHMGTSDESDDRVADFTNGGSDARRADLVAPGRSLVSLRNPGSHADLNHPEGLVAGDTSARLFRGSGTSQAAAVVSGATALLLQQRPTLTPDQVKRLLTSTAVKLPAETTPAQGAGRININNALKTSTPTAATSAQPWAPSTGTGSLDLSRGTTRVFDPETGDMLSGEVDVLGGAWDGLRWSQASWNGTSWSGGTWNGLRWSGDTWSSDTWAGLRWSSTCWDGLRWSGLRWSGLRWSNTSWDGLRWSGDGWSGLRWSGLRWSSDGWKSDGWTGVRWH